MIEIQELTDLFPGFILTQPQVEAMVGLKRADYPEEYRLKLLGIATEIYRRVYREGHEEYVVTTLRGGVKILTHSEASVYNKRGFAIRTAGLTRDHMRQQGVDIRELDSEQRDVHDESLIYQSRILGAISRERAEIRLEAHKRDTPKL